MVLGRLTHYAFDAVLFSAFLAGVKRSTGLTPGVSISSQNMKGRANISTPRAPQPFGRERSVGSPISPSLDTDKITDNKDFKKWIDNYLGVGEWVMDQSIAVFGSTSYFERKR